MIKRSMILACLIVWCLYLSAPTVSASSEDKPEKTSTIAVTGTATDEVPPDTAVITLAAERARGEAEVVAGALGVRLAGIRHIAPVCHKEGPSPVFRGAAMMKAAESAEPTTPIEAGTLTLNSSVAVEFYLEK